MMLTTQSASEDLPSGDNDAPRRLKRFDITPDAVLWLVPGVVQVVTNSVPADAKRVSAGYDAECDVFFIILESESFEPVTPGDRIPNFGVWLTLSRRTMEPALYAA